MTLDHIMTATPPVTPASPAAAVWRSFEAAPRLMGLAVVDESDTVLGLIERAALARLEFQHRPDAPDGLVFVGDLMDRTPLILELGTHLTDTVQRVLDHPGPDLPDTVIVSSQERYAGLIPTRALLRAARKDRGRLEAVALAEAVGANRHEASLRMMFEENPVPLVVFDQETYAILAVNQAACSQYGYDKARFLTLSVGHLLTPNERIAAENQSPEQRFSYQPSRSWRHRRADGQLLDILAYLSLLIVGDRPACMAACVDVTAQKAAEEELTRARWFLDAVIEAIPEMLVVKEGVEHRIVLINRAGEALLGLPREEIIGKNDYDLFPADQADFFVAQDKALLASGELQITPEEPITTANGLRYLQTKKIALPKGPNEAPHLVAICEDITERKATAEALKAARDHAESASRAKSEFLANMSHEIRTPLNGVTGVVSVLADTNLDPKQREMVRIIQDSAMTLELLLADVLDLARVESGKMELRREPFRIEDVTRRCGSLFRPIAEQKGLTFDVLVEPEAGGGYLGDPARLQQILNNLLSNAVKFTASGAVRLTVSRNTQDSRLQFTVADTGIGFDGTAADRIFRRFEQADGSITRQFGGTGLGLSISRDLAEAMGGALTATSAPGRGSIFTLVLPWELGEPAISPSGSTKPQPRGQTQSDGAPLKILVADDHPTNRQVVELILAAAGVELEMAENGADALDALARTSFDLVLMDLQMPVMDGLTAIREIRAREQGRRATPILALSANALPEHVAAAHEAGADGHIAKPVTAPALLAAIEAALADRDELEICALG
ncbi:MAG TPA: ATP-binding protein [Caulobacteraceae bacterium]